MTKRDPSLDYLLNLHGQVFFLDERGRYWVKFVVRRVPVTESKPHGLDYSLTLHSGSGERLLGFDNAHPVKGARGKQSDHMHRHKRVKPYAYRDAATLVEDFWKAVDKVIRERGDS